MKKRAENDPLKIEPDWKELVNNLDEEEISSISAKIIIYGVNTPQPLPPGSILGKITSRDSKQIEMPLQNASRPKEVLDEISSEFGKDVAERIREILERKFEKGELKSLNFNRQNARKLKYGSITGVSGTWKRTASGGTWTIYTNLEETKVLKVPHAAENEWESAILSLTHEKVAETIEKRFADSGLRAPGDHSVIATEVEGAKMALAIMDYEKNYVTDSNKKGLKKVQKMLKKLYKSGELPTHEFDYQNQGVERRKNLAYRDGEYIALDLCDKSVLSHKDYLETHGIAQKARKLGFSPSGNSSKLSGFLSRLF